MGDLGPGSAVQVAHLILTFLVVDVLGDLGPGSVVQVAHLFLTFLVVDVLGRSSPRFCSTGGTLDTYLPCGGCTWEILAQVLQYTGLSLRIFRHSYCGRVVQKSHSSTPKFTHPHLEHTKYTNMSKALIQPGLALEALGFKVL